MASSHKGFLRIRKLPELSQQQLGKLNLTQGFWLLSSAGDQGVRGEGLAGRCSGNQGAHAASAAAGKLRGMEQAWGSPLPLRAEGLLPFVKNSKNSVTTVLI